MQIFKYIKKKFRFLVRLLNIFIIAYIKPIFLDFYKLYHQVIFMLYIYTMYLYAASAINYQIREDVVLSFFANMVYIKYYILIAISINLLLRVLIYTLYYFFRFYEVKDEDTLLGYIKFVTELSMEYKIWSPLTLRLCVYSIRFISWVIIPIHMFYTIFTSIEFLLDFLINK